MLALHAFDVLCSETARQMWVLAICLLSPTPSRIPCNVDLRAETGEGWRGHGHIEGLACVAVVMGATLDTDGSSYVVQERLVPRGGKGY